MPINTFDPPGLAGSRSTVTVDQRKTYVMRDSAGDGEMVEFEITKSGPYQGVWVRFGGSGEHRRLTRAMLAKMIEAYDAH